MLKLNNLEMIDIIEYSKLNKDIRAKLDILIENEFGHIPIVKETEWAVPNWTIINYGSNDIQTFYNLILREIKIDGVKCKIGGVNNVITPHQFRGKGHSTETLSKTEYLIFEEFKCEYGILLCADSLIPFYERLNWYKINCPVYFNQSSGKKLWQANAMMLSKSNNIQPINIDLEGLPW